MPEHYNRISGVEHIPSGSEGDTDSESGDSGRYRRHNNRGNAEAGIDRSDSGSPPPLYEQEPVTWDHVPGYLELS